MPRKFLGQIIFLRHGETDYTDIFPDLTLEGTKTIKKTALTIGSILPQPVISGNGKQILIFSSPKIRSLGTASIIAKELAVKQKVIKETTLSAIAIKDNKRAKTLFDEVCREGAGKNLSIAYGSDPRFEDGIIVESRSEVKKRFFYFFAKLSNWFVANMGSPLYIIGVSHYEVLYHLVETLFELNYEKDEPLKHGELIVISMYNTNIRNVVKIEITFRKKTVKKLFDYEKMKIK